MTPRFIHNYLKRNSDLYSLEAFGEYGLVILGFVAIELLAWVLGGGK